VTFLLDTNAISEIRRDRDARVRAWASQVDDATLHLSVLTIGEVRTGIERLRRRDPVQADVFADWLGQLHERFADRILPVDSAVADDWGRLNAPAPRNTVDSLIAATARIHGMTVVTRNTSDFANCDVQLINPWEYEPEEPRDG
jgi:predicted nucleic acid-binding protein